MFNKRIDFFSSVRGGFFFEGLAKELDKHGWDCRLTSVLSDREYRTWEPRLLPEARKRWIMYCRAALACYKMAERRQRHGGICVTTTNPFYAPFITSRRRFGELSSVNWLLDLYPDALTLGGSIKKNGLMEAGLRWITGKTLRDSAANIFLGERLRQCTENKYGTVRNAVTIPLGADASIFPNIQNAGEHGENSINISYIGLMGRLHDWTTIAHSIKCGLPRTISLQFYATGSGYLQFCEEIGDYRGENLKFSGSLEETDWRQVMMETAIALVTLKRGSGDVVMPSKVYSALAAGQAIIAIADRNSDLAKLVFRFDCGWVIEPGDNSALEALLRRLPTSKSEIWRLRLNSQRAARTYFDLPIISADWIRVLEGIEFERREAARRSKVLYIHQHFCLPTGKGGTRSYEISKDLVDDLKAVKIVCGRNSLSGFAADQKADFSYNGINIRSYLISYKNELGFINRIEKFISYALFASWHVLFERYDVVFATSTPLTAGIPGVLGKVVRGKIFIFEERDRWPAALVSIGLLKNRYLISAMASLEKYCYRKADACIGLSPGIIAGMQADSPEGTRIEFIPNGADIELFGKGTKSSFHNTKLSVDKRWFVYVGAHGLANNLDIVLDSCQHLKDRGVGNVQIVLVGEGMEKERLVKRSQNEKLDNCVFLDALPKIEVARLLSAADVGLLIMKNINEFYYGTSPNKFFDYLAAGLPIINNYPGWAAELISKWGCGAVVSPDSSERLADAIEWLGSCSAVILSDMGESSRRLAENEFSRRQLNAKVCNLINEINYKRLFGGDVDARNSAQRM